MNKNPDSSSSSHQTSATPGPIQGKRFKKPLVMMLLFLVLITTHLLMAGLGYVFAHADIQIEKSRDSEKRLEQHQQSALYCNEYKERLDNLPPPPPKQCPHCHNIKTFPRQSSYRRSLQAWEQGAAENCNNCKRLINTYKQIEQNN